MMWWMMALACAPKSVDLGPIPEVGTATEFTPVQPKEVTLKSGARLWLVEDPGLPVVVVRVLLPGGASSDGAAWGQASLAAQMLTESAGERSTLELAGELRLQASSLWARSGRSTTEIGFSSHVDRLGQGLPLLADVILRPAFVEEDWERVVDQNLQGFQQLLEDGKAQSRAFDQYFLYGAEHPLGTPTGGVPSTLSALDRDATAAWHQSRLVGSEVDIVVVGDLDLEEAASLLDTHLDLWPGTEFAEPVIPDLEFLPGEGRLLMLDLPGAQQTAVRVLSRAWAPEDTVAPAAELAGVVLGGSFTSRLNHLLRETKGYTYGAYCSFQDGRHGGTFVASTNVRTDATTPALFDLNGVLVGALQGFTEEEHGKARSQYRNDSMDSHASRSGLVGALSTMMAQDRGIDDLVVQLASSQAVSLAEMNAAAPLAIPERGLTLLVGDESVIGKPLLEAGIHYERVEIPE